MGKLINLCRGYSSEVTSNEGVSAEIETHSGWGNSYLARLLGVGGKFGFERKFLTSSREKLSRAGNGSLFFDDLTPGVYEASSVYRSYRTFRAYFEVRDDGTFDYFGEDRDAAKARLLEAGARVLPSAPARPSKAAFEICAECDARVYGEHCTQCAGC